MQFYKRGIKVYKLELYTAFHLNDILENAK